MTAEPILKIAIQKSGRLSEDSLELLKECGIDFDANRGSNRLRSKAANFPLEVLFLRDDDIPGYVADGVADAGIVGENVLVESGSEVELNERLGFSRCRLCLAVPRASAYSGLQSLEGKKIATSYPRILGRFLEEKKIKATIHEISGSVELAPGIGLAEAICDIVSSGSTLFANGLQEVEVVFRSEATLIGSPKLCADKRKILDKLQFRIRSVRRAHHNKYILLNAPNHALDKIISYLPGMKSPTVVPLAMEGWSSVHSVLHEDDFWQIIEQIREAGAQGILVIPIEKMIV